MTFEKNKCFAVFVFHIHIILLLETLSEASVSHMAAVHLPFLLCSVCCLIPLQVDELLILGEGRRVEGGGQNKGDDYDFCPGSVTKCQKKERKKRFGEGGWISHKILAVTLSWQGSKLQWQSFLSPFCFETRGIFRASHLWNVFLTFISNVCHRTGASPAISTD